MLSIQLTLGSQQSNDMKEALDSEVEKTRLMEESMLKLGKHQDKPEVLESVMSKIFLSLMVYTEFRYFFTPRILNFIS